MPEPGTFAALWEKLKPKAQLEAKPPVPEAGQYYAPDEGFVAPEDRPGPVDFEADNETPEDKQARAIKYLANPEQYTPTPVKEFAKNFTEGRYLSPSQENMDKAAALGQQWHDAHPEAAGKMKNLVDRYAMFMDPGLAQQKRDFDASQSAELQQKIDALNYAKNQAQMEELKKQLAEHGLSLQPPESAQVSVRQPVAFTRGP